MSTNKPDNSPPATSKKPDPEPTPDPAPDERRAVTPFELVSLSIQIAASRGTQLQNIDEHFLDAMILIDNAQAYIDKRK